VTGEAIRVDLDTPAEFCGVCRKDYAAGLRLTLVDGDGERHEVAVCRDCLAEHMPELLAEIDRQVTEGPSG
jgi:hypothetical protein